MREVSQRFPFLKTDRLIFGISETSKMTGISTRQLRYWEKRGYIQSLEKKVGESRKYNFKTIIAITSIKHFLDNGYTLQAAVSKVSDITYQTTLIKDFIVQRYNGLTQIDGIPAIDLGALGDDPAKNVYGLMAQDTIKIVVR